MDVAARLRTLPRSVVALVALLVVGVVLLLPGLGDGALQPFDEALHGTLARHMRAAGKYLALVDEHGAYSMEIGFSKPPLLLWLIALSMSVFDASLFSLRLPSALATLAIGVLLFVFARRLDDDHARGARTGLVAGVLLMATEGAMSFGRTSNIEPVYTVFALTTLLLAIRARDGGRVGAVAAAVGAGVALGLAFMTKQIVALLALFPIVVMELISLRRERGRAVLRIVVPVVIAVGIGATWVALAWQALGDDLVDILWRFTVKDRIAGFGGDRHFNWLNRIAENLDTYAAPLPWPLAVVGLFHFAVARQRARDDLRLDPAWFLVLFFFGAVLAFENVSRSTLVWYVFSMLPPLALGAAHLVTLALSALSPTPGRATSPWAGLGVAVAVLVVDRALVRVASRVDAAIIVALLVLALVVVARTRAVSARAPERLPAVLVVAFLGVVVGGALRHPSHTSGPGVEESLMARAGVFGETPVSVDERILARGPALDLRRGTLFGPRARRTPPPWERASDARVRVELATWPVELAPREGVTVLRGPGGVVLAGALREPPFSSSDVDALLARGPLTFEAEESPSDFPETLTHGGPFAGGGARVRRPFRNTKPPSGTLTSGPWFPLPAGAYVARFDVGYRCGSFAWKETIGKVEVRRDGVSVATKTIACAPDAPSGEKRTTLEVPFRFDGDGRLDLVVTYNRGELMHDRTQVQRRVEEGVTP